MRLFITSCLIIFFSVHLEAQVSQPARWEQENEFMSEAYSIVSLKEEGLALIREKDKFQHGKRVWDLVVLDTALQQKWATEFELHDELRFTGYEYLPPGKLNLMFRRNETEMLRAEMLMIDLNTHEINHSKTEVKLQIRLTHYTVVDKNCIFGGYVGTEPVLVIHDPDKNSTFIVPGFFLTDTELMDVRPNRNGTFNILLFQRSQAKKKIIFRTFDKFGTILVEDEIAIDDDKNILSAATSVLEHDEVLIGGSYGFKNNKQASGIFNCMIDPFAEQHITYTEFHQLRHFLDYMPDKKAARIRENAMKRMNGNKPPEFHTNVGVHRIEEFDNGFALFGESYIISSAGSSNAFANPYNPSIRAYGNPYGYTPFANRYYNNPYQYSNATGGEELKILQAFVVGYDFKGKRLWDYTIPMDEFKMPGRDQVADFAVVKGVTNFFYKDEDKLMFLNTSTDTVDIVKPLSLPIRLKNESDELKERNESEGNVRHWYGSFFYVWGIQRIKDRSSREFDSTRRVFFINKIQVE
jgi:hypothetical protein